MVTKEESVGSLTDPVPAGEFGLCDALRAGVRTVGTYHYESCVIMIRGIARLLAKLFGALVLLSATIFIIVAFNERETASVLANSLRATLQGGRDIEATSPQTHVDYFAETALRISFFTFLVSTFGTAFTVLLGWRSDREFKLKIVQLEAQVAELKRQSLKDKAGPSQPSS
jgi:hypothetical protein